MEIYAPLAERMGMHQLKDELENLAFAELNPDAYQSIIQRLSYLREQGTDISNKIIAELQKTLKDADLDAEVSGREKTPFSIWRKMQKKRMEFEQLSDIMAFRVMVKDIGQCYQALGAIHGKYSMIPGRFKDYISTPKPNNYQSLHTGIIGPQRMRIEVQIRAFREQDQRNVTGTATLVCWHRTRRSGLRRWRWRHRNNRSSKSWCRPSQPPRARACLQWHRWATRSHPRPNLRHPSAHRHTTCGRC